MTFQTCFQSVTIMRAIQHSFSPLRLTSSIVSSISLGVTGPVVESVLVRMVRLVRPSFRRNAAEDVVIALPQKALNTNRPEASIESSESSTAVGQPTCSSGKVAVEVEKEVSPAPQKALNTKLFKTDIPFDWFHEQVYPQWVGHSPDDALRTLKDTVQTHVGNIQERASHQAKSSRPKADAEDLTAIRQALEEFSDQHHGFAYSPALRNGVTASLHAVKAAILSHAQSEIDLIKIPVARPATTYVGAGMNEFPRVYGDLSFHFLDLECWDAPDVPEELTNLRQTIVGHLLDIQQRNGNPKFEPADAKANIADLKAIAQALESAESAAGRWGRNTTVHLLPLRRQMFSTLGDVESQIDKELVRAVGC